MKLKNLLFGAQIRQIDLVRKVNGTRRNPLISTPHLSLVINGKRKFSPELKQRLKKSLSSMGFLMPEIDKIDELKQA
jgi:hypothetical protein